MQRFWSSDCPPAEALDRGHSGRIEQEPTLGLIGGPCSVANGRATPALKTHYSATRHEPKPAGRDPGQGGPALPGARPPPTPVPAPC